MSARAYDVIITVGDASGLQKSKLCHWSSF